MKMAWSREEAGGRGGRKSNFTGKNVGGSQHT
jgi:hypothetical protein